MKPRTKFNLIIAGVFLVLLIIFMVANRQVVELNFLLAQVQMPRSVLLIGVLLIGFLVGWVVRTMTFGKK